MLNKFSSALMAFLLVVGMSMTAVSAEDERETLDGVTHILPEHNEHIWYEDELDGQIVEIEVDWADIHTEEDTDEYRLEGVSILDEDGDFDNGQVGNFAHADTTYTADDIDAEEYDGHYIDDEMYSVADLREEIDQDTEDGEYYTVRTAIEGYDAEGEEWYFIGFHETTFSVESVGLEIESVDVETEEEGIVRPEDAIDFNPQGVDANTELDDIRVDFYADTELEDEYLNQDDEHLSWYLSDVERNEDEAVEDYEIGLLPHPDVFDDEEERQLPQAAEFTVMDTEGHEITATAEIDHIEALDWNTVLEANDEDSFEASIKEKTGFEIENDTLESTESDAEATFFSVTPDRTYELEVDVEELNDTSATVEVVSYDSSDYVVESEDKELEEGENVLEVKDFEGEYVNTYLELDSGDDLKVNSVKMTGTHQDHDVVIGSPTGNFFANVPSAFGMFETVTAPVFDLVNQLFDGIMGAIP